MATSIVWDDVVAFAPNDKALAELSETAQDLVLLQVGLEVSDATWGSAAKAKIAGLNLACHLGTLRTSKANAGSAPVSSVSAGGVSKSMAIGDPAALRSTLTLTKYGLEYLRLMRLWVRRFAALS